MKSKLRKNNNVKSILLFWGGWEVFFFGGGGPLPHFILHESFSYCQIRLPPEYFLAKPLWERSMCMKERIMPSLVAALPRTMHYIRTKERGIFLGTNLLVCVKLGYPPNFNFLGKPLYVILKC